MSAAIDEAIRRFRAIAELDPTIVEYRGERMPRQRAESLCIEDYLVKLEPAPSLALRLCAHCQHLRRFAYPRKEFPEGREGYLLWRREAARRSFAESAEILRALELDATLVEAVETIMLKRDRRHNRDVQTMEDALCLSFFRLDAIEFAERHALDDVLRILRRTWAKMSEPGKALALAEDYTPPLPELLRSVAESPQVS